MEREDIIQLARENGLRFDGAGYDRLVTPNGRWEATKIEPWSTEFQADQWRLVDTLNDTMRLVTGLIGAQECIDGVVFGEEN